MATRTFTNGGVNNLWSTAGNWDTPPADNDTVVIASGQTCEFDVDTSGWANGINGMTITGTLKVSKTTSSYMKMKAATLITGAGTFNIGESGAGNNIPFTTKFTLTGGAGWYIDGNAGLTMTVYGAEPTYKYIKLSGNEAIGQTELSVDTDVTGDIWTAGDTIRIDDIDKGRDSEERTIAAGGIASGAITITSGLTNAKITGAYVILVTRNIRIVAVGTGSRTIYRVSNLTVASGEFAGVNKVFIETCTVNMSGGVINNVESGLQYVTLTISGGIITGGNTQAMRYVYFLSTSGGLVSGCLYGLRACYGNVGAITISGCTEGITEEHAYQSIAPLTLNGTTVQYSDHALNQLSHIRMTDIILVGNTNGIYFCDDICVNGGTFTNNTYHIRASTGVGYNLAFTGGTENYRWDNQDQNYKLETFEILNYGGTEGAYKSWTIGGIVTSQTTVLPAGYSIAYLHTPVSATLWCFKRNHFIVPAGESISIDVQLRKSVSMVYLPRVYLMNSIQDPINGTPVDSFIMTDSTDTWESDTFSVDNSSGTTDKEYTLWFVGKNASGSMYSAYDITTAGGGGGGSVKIVPLGGIRL